MKLNKDSMAVTYMKWRGRAWEYGQESRTPEEKWQAWSDRAIFGRNRFAPGEHSVAYEMIARQVIAGDIQDAAGYVKTLVDRIKEPEDMMKIKAGLMSSMNNRAPLADIPKEKYNEFKRGLSKEEKAEVEKLEKDFRKNYEKAIKDGIKGWKPPREIK